MKKTEEQRLNSHQPRRTVSERFTATSKGVFKCRTVVKPDEMRITEKKMNVVHHGKIESRY